MSQPMSANEDWSPINQVFMSDDDFMEFLDGLDEGDPVLQEYRHGARILTYDNQDIELPEPGPVIVTRADGTKEEPRPMTDAEIDAWRKAEGLHGYET